MPEFTCDAPSCAFSIRANDVEEIIEHVQQHARDKHDRTVNEDHVRSRIED